MAAPVEDVMMPIVFGYFGGIFLYSLSNSPSVASFCFSASNAICNAPAPAGSICSIMS